VASKGFKRLKAKSLNIAAMAMSEVSDKWQNKRKQIRSSFPLSRERPLRMCGGRRILLSCLARAGVAQALRQYLGDELKPGETAFRLIVSGTNEILVEEARRKPT